MRRCMFLLCQGALDWKQQWIENVLSNLIWLGSLASSCTTSCVKVAGRSWNWQWWQKTEPLAHLFFCLCGHTRVWVSEFQPSKEPTPSQHVISFHLFSFIPFLFSSFSLFICWQILFEERFPSLFALCARAFIYLQDMGLTLTWEERNDSPLRILLASFHREFIQQFHLKRHSFPISMQSFYMRICKSI